MSVQENPLFLSYRTADGACVQARAVTVGTPGRAIAPLVTRSLKLEGGDEVRQVCVGQVVSVDDRERGYRMIDSEILAGLRLARMTRHGAYPPQVSRMIGFDADSARPYVLLERYRGEAVEAVAGHLLPAGQHRFQVSLLTGLRWLAEAGIAHRGIGPGTVRWDGEHAQITDFSLATVLEARREAVGTRPWAAPEQRPGQARGEVSAQDDIWAAGRLIYYVTTGEELSEREQLEDWPALADVLVGVFGPPERRPTAREMLTVRLHEADPVPPGHGVDPLVEKGRATFHVIRARRQSVPIRLADASADTVTGRKRRGRLWERRMPLLVCALTVLALIGLGVWIR
jgi:hypothetical protein